MPVEQKITGRVLALDLHFPDVMGSRRDATLVF